MKNNKKSWLHFSIKDYIENCNFAAELPIGSQTIGFPLFCVFFKAHGLSTSLEIYNL